MTQYAKVLNPEAGGHKSQEWAAKQANPSEFYPAVYEITSSPKSGGTNHRISEAWWEFTHDINELMGSTAGMIKARKMWSGWLNSMANPEYDAGEQLPRDPDPYPHVEGIITVHNYVEILARSNGSALIRIFDYRTAPPDINLVNPKMHPELFDFMHSVNAAGDVGNAPEGERFYFPRLAKDGIGWLPDDILEYNVDLPQENTMTDPIDGYTKGKDFSHHATFHNPGKSTDDTKFAILKGSDGTWNDPRTSKGGDLYESIRSYEVRGVYHYHRSTVNWKTQADSLLFQLEDPYFHFGNWDYERKNNLMGQAFADACQMAMEYLVARSEKKILLYSNVRGFNDDLRPYDQSSVPWYNDHLLWIAQWPWKVWIDRESKFEPTMPKDVDHWEIWQYGADAMNCYGYKEAHLYGLGKDSVDLNYFPGSLEDMKTYFNVDSTSPPPTEPPPDGVEYDAGYLDGGNDALDNVILHAENLKSD